MKKLLSLFLFLVMVFSTAACKSSSSSSNSGTPTTSSSEKKSKELFIGLSMHNQTETWAVQFKKTFVDAAKAAGCKVSVTDANSNASTQVSQIDDLVAQGINVLVVLPSDAKALGDALKKAHDAGVYIVNADSMVAEQDQSLVTCFVTADCYKAGYSVGEFLSEKLAKNAVIGALNYPQLSVIADRFKGLATALKDKGRSDVKIVEKDVTDLSAIASYTEDMLMANPKICGFVCLNDNTALSCYGACAQLGHKKDIVIGFDGSPAGKQSISAGQMTGTMVYSPVQLAKASFKAAQEIFNKQAYD